MGNQETLNCIKCKAPKIIARMSTVGDKMRLSGYEPVMLTDTSVIWFCPGCVEALRPYVKAIVEATGGRSLYWDNMIAMAFLGSKPAGEGVLVGKKET